jgi:NAD dependent epimerase/dehydratase family
LIAGSRISVGLGQEMDISILTVEHAVIPYCISFIAMTLILVCDYSTFRYMPQVTDPTTLNYQVTGASGFVGSHVVDELLRQGYSVRGYASVLKLQSCTVNLRAGDCCQGGSKPQHRAHKQKLRIVRRQVHHHRY